MKLLHLKIACYLYNQFTGYDDNYLQLSKAYPNLDLNQNTHIKALLKWLRSWGCRQFKSDDEKLSVNSIMDWYSSKKAKIPHSGEHLIDYDLANNKELVIEIFDDLLARKAATKQREKHDIDVRIGPVGAAKILFALRPNLFSPWDTPIYKKFQLTDNGSGYVGYLARIQNDLLEIRDEMKNTNISWDNLFGYLEKKHSSYPKLIDEYYWTTVTRGCNPSVIENFCNYNNDL